MQRVAPRGSVLPDVALLLGESSQQEESSAGSMHAARQSRRTSRGTSILKLAAPFTRIGSAYQFGKGAAFPGKVMLVSYMTLAHQSL